MDHCSVDALSSTMTIRGMSLGITQALQLGRTGARRLGVLCDLSTGGSLATGKERELELGSEAERRSVSIHTDILTSELRRGWVSFLPPCCCCCYLEE